MTLGRQEAGSTRHCHSVMHLRKTVATPRKKVAELYNAVQPSSDTRCEELTLTSRLLKSNNLVNLRYLTSSISLSLY